MNIAELMNSACDKTKAPAYHNEFWTITQAELERFTALVLAAHTAKLLAGVEMPEYKYIDRHDVPKEGMCVYTQDQLQSYAAAAAVQARMKALDEAKMEAVKRHNAGEAAGILISAAIESLKGKP